MKIKYKCNDCISSPCILDIQQEDYPTREPKFCPFAPTKADRMIVAHWREIKSKSKKIKKQK